MCCQVGVEGGEVAGAIVGGQPGALEGVAGEAGDLLQQQCTPDAGYVSDARPGFGHLRGG